jgi:hypothetical protein
VKGVSEQITGLGNHASREAEVIVVGSREIHFEELNRLTECESTVEQI